MILFLWVLGLACSILGQADACRTLEFTPPKDGYALINHVIRSVTLDRRDSCQVACYVENDCLSYNFGFSGNGHFLCQLSDSDDIQHPNDLNKYYGFTYMGTKNACASNLCSHGKCAIRATDNSYYCKCHPGYVGNYCKEKVYRNCSEAPRETGIYHIQPSDASRPLPVYCDQASDGGGWTMVFKVVANASPSYAYELWVSHDTYSETVTAALNTTTTHFGHYKNRVVLKEYWGTFNPTEAKVVLYEKGKEVRYLKFNTTAKDNIHWFSQRTLISSSWNDLKTTQSLEYFAIKGDQIAQRSFEISEKYAGGCPRDVGWLIITSNNTNYLCPWESRHTRPSILYSKESTSVKYNVTSKIGIADVFAVFLR